MQTAFSSTYKRRSLLRSRCEAGTRPFHSGWRSCPISVTPSSSGATDSRRRYNGITLRMPNRRITSLTNSQKQFSNSTFHVSRLGKDDLHLRRDASTAYLKAKPLSLSGGTSASFAIYGGTGARILLG